MPPNILIALVKLRAANYEFPIENFTLETFYTGKKATKDSRNSALSTVYTKCEINIVTYDHRIFREAREELLAKYYF